MAWPLKPVLEEPSNDLTLTPTSIRQAGSAAYTVLMYKIGHGPTALNVRSMKTRRQGKHKTDVDRKHCMAGQATA